MPEAKITDTITTPTNIPLTILCDMGVGADVDKNLSSPPKNKVG